jgi:hypothetical protein
LITASALLPYRMYLTAYDADQGKLYDRTRTAFLVQAAIFAELLLSGYLVDADGLAQVARNGPAGDPVLDAILQNVASAERSWKAHIRHGYKDSLRETEEGLVRRGELRQSRTRILGLMPRQGTVALNSSSVRQLQGRLASLLRGSEPASQVDARDATAAALAGYGRVPTVITRSEARERRDRVHELASAVRDLAPGLADAMQGISMTSIAAQGGLGGS